jgi:hypothetical protein
MGSARACGSAIAASIARQTSGWFDSLDIFDFQQDSDQRVSAWLEEWHKEKRLGIRGVGGPRHRLSRSCLVGEEKIWSAWSGECSLGLKTEEISENLGVVGEFCWLKGKVAVLGLVILGLVPSVTNELVSFPRRSAIVHTLNKS